MSGVALSGIAHASLPRAQFAVPPKETEADCYSCQSNAGVRRISPGVPIFTGTYWIVEHAYPCKIRGWLVLVLRRHCDAVHELTEGEFSELSSLLSRTTRVLAEVLRCEKEYVAQFAEAEHFHHVHFHVIPKPLGLPSEEIGPGVFVNLRGDGVPEDEVNELCKGLAARF